MTTVDTIIGYRDSVLQAVATPHDVLLSSARSEGLAAAKKQPVMATVVHLQQSVGCVDGVSHVIKSIQCFVESDYSWILHVSSRAMLHSIEQHDSEGSTTRLCPYPRQLSFAK